jgi:hypothetical protein
MRRISIRIRHLEEKPRQRIAEERILHHDAAIERMRSTSEGRDALEQLERMLAEAEPIPVDDPARPGARVRAAMRSNPDYVRIVSRFRNRYVAAQEEIKNEQEVGTR